jgi:hypothetical protein
MAERLFSPDRTTAGAIEQLGEFSLCVPDGRVVPIEADGDLTPR